MRRLASMELRKALVRNPWFWASLAVGCAIALLSAQQGSVVFQNTLDYALEHWDEADALYSAASCFAFWMPIRTFELWPGVFMMTWPLLAAIPYTWSWCDELRSGAFAQLAARAPRARCAAAKLTAAFVSGALSLAVPYLVNLLACMCFAPAAPVWISDVLYVGVAVAAPFSSVFYTAPGLFCVLWTCVASVVAGLWAAAVASAAALLGSYLQAVVGSYLLLHVAAYAGGQLGWLLVDTGAVPRELQTALYLDVFSTVSVLSSTGATWALLLTVCVLATLPPVLVALRARRDLL